MASVTPSEVRKAYPLSSQAPGSAQHRRGNAISLGFRPADTDFFDVDGLRVEACV
jgi:hypothetical protein